MEKKEAAEVFDLIVKNGQLPANLEKLVPLSFIGQMAVSFYRDKIKLLNQLNVAEEQREATLHDGQNAGKLLLDIETRIGELYNSIPPRPGQKRGEGKAAEIEKIGIKRQAAERAQAIYNNPSAVAEVIKEAEENEDIPTKTAVLKHIALIKLKEKEIKKEKTLPDINGVARDVHEKLSECLAKLVKIWPHKDDLTNYNMESIQDIVMQLGNIIFEEKE